MQKSNDPLAWELLGYLHTLRGDHAAATEALGKCFVSSRSAFRIVQLCSIDAIGNLVKQGTDTLSPQSSTSSAGFSVLAKYHTHQSLMCADLLALMRRHWPYTLQRTMVLAM